jgi:hypothetical protein
MGRPPVQRDRKRHPRPANLDELRMAANSWPTTLYEYHGPVVKLKRFGQKGRLATWRPSEKITKFLLRLVSFSDPLLQ